MSSVTECAGADMVSESGRNTGDFEYQMCYGIRGDERRRLAAAGSHMARRL
jgi:hypothetical protein